MHYYAVACVLMWASIGIILLNWYAGQDSISYVAATNKVTYITIAVGVVSAATLSLLFCEDYFFKKITAPPFFKLIFYTSIMAMFGVGLIPATKGPSLQLHTVLAGILSFCMFAIALCFASMPQIRTILRVQSAITVVIMLVLVFLTTGIHIQILGIVSLNALILEITYFNKGRSIHD